jgi:type I restriction enzyme S subunit
MELTKTKYKNTDVGLIPEDWNVFVLSSLLNGIYDVDHYMPKTEKNGIPYLMTGDLKEVIGDIDFDNCKKISETDYKQLSKKVKNSIGDIILARYATVGTVSFVNIDFDFIVSYSCVTIKPNNSKLLSLFLFYYFKSNTFKLEVNNKVNANIQDNVGIGDLYKMKIALPPSLEEQKAIATALSDVDDLINNLEKLIAKKKAIKQGAMQQLLTPPNRGGKRLEGFSGEWVEKRLEEISKIKTGSKNNQDKIEDGLFPFFVRSQTIERINTYSYDCEAILVPGEGGIGSIFHYINGKFEVHQRVYKISDFEIDVVGKYIFLQMLFSFGKHAMTNSVKATVDSLRLPTFEEFAVPIPPTIEEQKYISNILTEMDGELEQLENRKSKYQSIKQGMMQELLTGKTRLV